MTLRMIVTQKVDLLQAGDGTTVLVRLDPDPDGMQTVAKVPGDVRVLLYCGGDDAHCDADGWCEHTRELVAAQDVLPGRKIELVPRARRP